MYTVKLKHNIIEDHYKETVITFDNFEDAIQFAKKENLDIPGSVVNIQKQND